MDANQFDFALEQAAALARRRAGKRLDVRDFVLLFGEPVTHTGRPSEAAIAELRASRSAT